MTWKFHFYSNLKPTMHCRNFTFSKWQNNRDGYARKTILKSTKKTWNKPRITIFNCLSIVIFLTSYLSTIKQKMYRNNTVFFLFSALHSQFTLNLSKNSAYNFQNKITFIQYTIKKLHQRAKIHYLSVIS